MWNHNILHFQAFYQKKTKIMSYVNKKILIKVNNYLDNYIYK